MRCYPIESRAKLGLIRATAFTVGKGAISCPAGEGRAEPSNPSFREGGFGMQRGRNKAP
jgi:hypothetical protein